MTFTRSQIEAIAVGGFISHMGGKPSEILEITCKREDVNGKLFVHGYRRFSENSRISFSIKEGNETDASLYRVAQ